MSVKSFNKILQRVFFEIFVIILTVLFVFILVPLIFILLSPLYLYRLIIYKLSSVLRKDLGKILTARTHLYAIDNLYDCANCNLLGVITVKGDLDLKAMRSVVLDKISEEDNTGELMRPEMFQYITSWRGYLFYKQDLSFDIKNHVNYYPMKENEYIDEIKLREIEKELIRSPYHHLRSPWEFFILRDFRYGSNDQEFKSIIFFKVHHSLGDGFSIAKLLSHIASFSPRCVMPEYEKRKQSFIQQICLGLGILIRGPYDFIHTILQINDVNEYHPKMITKEVSHSVTSSIPLKIFKDIKNTHKVSLTSVILASICGGIRAHMIKAGRKLPEKIHAGVALPFSIERHRNKLRNNLSCCLVELPVGVSDPRQRLQLIDQHIQSIKKSTAPLIFFWLWKLIGSLPVSLVKIFGRNSHITSIVSNFPGPPLNMEFIGHEITDMYFLSGLLHGNTTIITTSVSYKERIKFAIHADKKIIPTDDSIDSLKNMIIDELKFLINNQAENV